MYSSSSSVDQGLVLIKQQQQQQEHSSFVVGLARGTRDGTSPSAHLLAQASCRRHARELQDDLPATGGGGAVVASLGKIYGLFRVYILQQCMHTHTHSCLVLLWWWWWWWCIDKCLTQCCASSLFPSNSRWAFCRVRS